MDSDEVNSITDTVESLQVVEVIKTVYDDIISRGGLQTNKTLFNLSASNDPSKPILMVKPNNIDRIEWIKYDVRKDAEVVPVWNTLSYLPIQDFIDYIHSYNQGENNVESFTHVFDGFTVDFVYRNDTHPLYFTTYDDEQIFFDAYDNAVDNTLQASKTLCYGTKPTEFQKVDGFIPDLQPQQFALLLNESKSLAWAELKQTIHQKAEATARKNWSHLQKTRQEIPDQSKSGSKAFNLFKSPNFARPR